MVIEETIWRVVDSCRRNIHGGIGSAISSCEGRFVRDQCGLQVKSVSSPQLSNPISREVYVFRYDHLTECVSRVLDERPLNAAGNVSINATKATHMSCSDLLEDISRTIKKEKLQLKTDTLVVGTVWD